MAKNITKILSIMMVGVILLPTQVQAFIPDNGFIPIEQVQSEETQMPNNVFIPIQPSTSSTDDSQSTTHNTDTTGTTQARVRKPLLTTPPKVGSQIAEILIDENVPVYNADGKPNRDNFNGAYFIGNIGQCAWYASGRFYEATGIDDYTYTYLFTPVSMAKGLPQSIWLDNADKEDLPAVYSIRDSKGIVPQSIAVWDGHVVFVEYVEYDNNGNPTEVYFSEANYNNDTNGRFRPKIDGVIKKQSFNDFINRSMHGEIKGYVAAR